MRFLLTTIGTAGDVHPFVAIGLALKARGHEVVILANPHFAPRINSAGLGFWPLGTEAEYLAFVRHAGLVAGVHAPTFVIDNLILPSFHPTVEAIRRAREVFRPDLVFAHHISIGAPAASEVLDIPFAQGVLAPLFWISRQESVVLPILPWRSTPGWVAVLVRRALRPVGRWVVDRPVNSMRREIGARSLRDIGVLGPRGGDGLFPHERIARERAVRTLALWSPHFRPPLHDDPSNGTICGFATWDRPATTPDAIEHERDTLRWMDEGEPPIVVTLGSSVSHHGADVYRVAAKAAEQLGKRALLLTGIESNDNWPSCVRAVPYAPYSRVMPRGCVTVHHAGIGTTAAAMRAGRPQVIIPFANDEFDNAARAERLGVALTIPRRRLSVRTLCKAIERAISDAVMPTRSTELGALMQGEDGALAAAVELERLARTPRPG